MTTPAVSDGATVLFVDDEPHILAGLRRTLHGHVPGWRMLFAAGGHEALELLRGTAVDAVVTDMRMPGMNGAQLLAEVRLLYPATARLVLSGQAERSVVLAAVTHTQQFMAKPCDAAALVHAVEGVLSVRRKLTDGRLRELFGSVGALPTPPAVYDRLVEVLARPDADLDDVAEVISTSVTTSAEVLRLVNSAFFGLPRQVDSVAGAVRLLGMENVQALVLASAVFAPSGASPGGPDPQRLQETGLLRAGMLRRIITAEDWQTPDAGAVGLAALLRDLGLVVLGGARPDAYAALAADLPDDPIERDLAERAAFGCSVPEASAYLLGLWGFPDLVVHLLARQPVRTDDAGASDVDRAFALAHERAWAAWPGIAEGQSASRTSHTAPSGGTRSATEAGIPCQGTSSASTPPRLPTPEPP